MAANSKDNPAPFGILDQKLNLPHTHKIPRGTRRRNPQEWWRLKRLNNAIIKERERILSPYKAGKYKEWEGDGYFMTQVYLYEGVYYG